MSSIPYNYGSYIDAKVAMTDTGHVSAGKQIQSPASAGSRGLAKTTQFTNDRTQMQMGNSPIAESMVEIRSILNRIDGVNAPEQSTDEAKSGITDANYKLLMLDISAMKDRISELNIDDDSKTRALTALGDVEDELNFDESAVQEDDMQDLTISDLEAQLGKINDEITFLKIDEKDKESALAALGELRSVLDKYQSQKESFKPFPEGDEFNIEEDEDFEEVLGPLGFPEDETELFDAEYQGRKVPLNKPMRGDVKKFKVYVKDPKTGNVKKVNFGHGGTSAKRKTMRIRKSNPKARKSFRARHNCANPGPKTKARYWSCRKW